MSLALSTCTEEGSVSGIVVATGKGTVETNLGLGGNNLALTNPLALGSHGERLLQLLAKHNVLDEHALNLYTPAGGNILDNLANRLRELLPTLNDVLQNARTNDVAQGGLGPLDQGLTNIGDSKGGFVRAHDVVIDDRGEVQGDVVFGHADLLRDLDDLNLDIDLDQALGERVDLDQAGIDGLVEFAELGDQADIALVHVLVRVGTKDAAWNGAQGSNASAKAVDCFATGRVSSAWTATEGNGNCDVLMLPYQPLASASLATMPA